MKILARRVASAGASSIGGCQGAGAVVSKPPISGPEDTLRLFWSSMATRSERLGKLAADDPPPTFKKSTIRMVLIDVESSHLLNSEK